MINLSLIDIGNLIDSLRPYFIQIGILTFLFTFLIMLGMCEIFQKAKKPGWGVVVPFYNLYLLYDIIYQNGWMFLFLLIPGVNIVFLLTSSVKLAKVFGHGVFFGFLTFLFPFIFYPILGIGNSDYRYDIPLSNSRIVEADDDTLESFVKSSSEDADLVLAMKALAGGKSDLSMKESVKNDEVLEYGTGNLVESGDPEKSNIISSNLLDENVLALSSPDFIENEIDLNKQSQVMDMNSPFEREISGLSEKELSSSTMNFSVDSSTILKSSMDNSGNATKSVVESLPQNTLPSESTTMVSPSGLDSDFNRTTILLDAIASIDSVLGNTTVDSTESPVDGPSIKTTKNGDDLFPIDLSSLILVSELSSINSIVSPKKVEIESMSK